MKKPYCAITLNALELAVHLGWPDDERSNKQTVWLDVHLSFPDELAACATDNLSDTYCYGTLVQQITEGIEQKSFHLIEHLGSEIYHLIRLSLPPHIKVHLRLKKYPAAIPHLKGGVTFHYGDDDDKLRGSALFR